MDEHLGTIIKEAGRAMTAWEDRMFLYFVLTWMAAAFVLGWSLGRILP